MKWMKETGFLPMTELYKQQGQQNHVFEWCIASVKKTAMFIQSYGANFLVWTGSYFINHVYFKPILQSNAIAPLLKSFTVNLLLQKISTIACQPFADDLLHPLNLFERNYCIDSLFSCTLQGGHTAGYRWSSFQAARPLYNIT